jgi:hypothetical protein
VHTPLAAGLYINHEGDLPVTGRTAIVGERLNISPRYKLFLDLFSLIKGFGRMHELFICLSGSKRANR